MEKKSSKTKVLLVITKSNFGGAQKYVFDLATDLPREQFDVAVVLGGAGILAGMLSARGVRVISLPSLNRDVNPFKDLASFFALWKLFRVERPDVVHLNSSKVGGIGALAGRLAFVPKIIFTAHAWAFNEDRTFLSRTIIKTLSWLTIIFSHKTIAVSEAIQKQASRWPFVANKIITIKNGVTEPKFYTREDARARLCAIARTSLPSGAFLLGTIAELHKNKGLNYAIEAFAKLANENPSLHYFIIGGGEEQEHLGALVESLGLQKRVFLLGFLADAPRFLPAFDVFVLPSLTEALGLVILEAGLAGLPVVASREGGIPEIIDEGRTGILVPAKNPEAIANAISKLQADQALAKRLGETLREHVLKNFSFNQVLVDTVALYTEN